MAIGAVKPILTQHSSCDHTMLLVTDGKEEVEKIKAPRGIVFLQARADSLIGNATQTQLSMMVDKVRQMSELWHCLALVLMSDDAVFLAAFAHMSLRRHALRWSIRILVLTRLPLGKLGGLHSILSNRNAVLLFSRKDKTITRVDVYMWQPYSAPDSTPLRVATWTPHTLAVNMQLFPDKFYVFSSAPTLTVGIELIPHHKLSWVEDASALDGRSLKFTGYADIIVKYFAQAMNFTFRYVVSPERTYGSRLPNGSWTGLLGLVVREEADFAPGPFIISPVRRQAADHTTTFYYGNLRILSGLPGLNVDPWGFFLPLTPLVWAATLAALLGILAVHQILSLGTPGSKLGRGACPTNNAFSYVRVIFQQDIVLPVECWWWWERLVLGLWMLVTLVLVKSYSGNLMSLLAVRYLPQPFQTLRDVLDASHVTMIGQKDSNFEQNLRDVKTGIFREVAEMEGVGRLKFHTQAQYIKSLDTLVKAGHHVFFDVDMNLRSMIALDFSQKGRCDFYISRDGFLPYAAAMMVQKTSPLVHGFNKRFLTLVEQGMIRYWMENVPNFTECENVPRKMLVTSQISVSNIWGLFVVLAAGLAAGMLVFYAELLISLLHQ
ncbi:glutamate receptor ionotropic, delta-2-like isoform X2 [Eriocheir sinensis]|nr:glutamate receptor ionotropic, delta-2-like isoform X2 [Eriocheir sinensis]